MVNNYYRKKKILAASTAAICYAATVFMAWLGGYYGLPFCNSLAILTAILGTKWAMDIDYYALLEKWKLK